MVADIDVYTQSSSPQNITDVGGTVFFTATPNSYNGNVELYKTDGTAAGTTQLTFGNRLSSFQDLTSFNGKLWFDASDDVFGHRVMYTSDGTVAGTTVFQPGGDTLDLMASDPDNNTSTRVAGSKFYFEAYDGTNGFYDLWVTNGSASGTHPVLPNNANAPNAFNLLGLTNVNGKVYFSDYDSAHSEWAVWKSDGTAGGTSLIAELSSSQPINFAAVGSELFFEMYDGGTGKYALWHSDGTAGNTTMVSDIGTAVNQQFYSATSFGGKLLFLAYDTTAAPNTNYALWSSDGTAGNTGVFKFNSSSTAVQAWGGSQQMIVFNSDLYLPGWDATHGYSLWKSDGSASNNATGTVQTGSPTPFNGDPTQETIVGTDLYFLATNTSDSSNYDLWKTDGTSANTVPVQTSGFARNIDGVNSHMTDSGSKVFFTARDADSNGNSPHGYELWSSDGTNANTAMIIDINTNTYGSNPTNLTAVGSEIFFSAYTYSPLQNHSYLWQSDGTVANTAPVETAAHVIPTGTNNYVADGSTLFFTATGSNGNDLWTSGTGTDSAVEMFPTGTNPFSGDFDGDPSKADAFAAIGSELYFGALDAANAPRYALWQSNGTASGTTVVADLDVNQQLYHLTAVGSNLFWDEWDATNSEYALWEYNGSTAAIVADITSDGAGLFNLTAVGSSVFFEAYDTNAGEYALWTSNGTTTTKLVDFTNGDQFYDPIAFDSKLFFIAYDTTLGQWTIWTSDGTLGGTGQFLSTTSQPVYTTSTPDFTIDGSELFGDFIEVGGGDVLGKTDGTAAGTVMVQLGTSGTVAINPNNMADDNGTLVFNADDSAHGYELWQSDGTSAGTLPTADIYRGTDSSNPQYLTTAGTQVFFNASDGIHGAELWTATIAPTVVTPGISGPTDGVTEQYRDFTLTASDSNSANNSAGFSFAINWGDGSTETVTGLSGVSADHQYATTGSPIITVTATNLADNVTSAAATLTDNITGTELQGGNLAVGALAGNNAFVITKGTGRSFTVTDNATTLLHNFTPATGEEILLYSSTGTTTIAINDSGTTKDTFTLGTGYVIFNRATFVATTPATWTVNGNDSTLGNTYTIVGAADASINGGSGPNTINVSTGGSLSGTLSAGSDTSKNLLSYAKYATSGVVVDLLLGSATAIDGGAKGGISGIENVTGSSVGGRHPGGRRQCQQADDQQGAQHPDRRFGRRRHLEFRCQRRRHPHRRHDQLRQQHRRAADDPRHLEDLDDEQLLQRDQHDHEQLVRRPVEHHHGQRLGRQRRGRHAGGQQQAEDRLVLPPQHRRQQAERHGHRRRRGRYRDEHLLSVTLKVETLYAVLAGIVADNAPWACPRCKRAPTVGQPHASDGRHGRRSHRSSAYLANPSDLGPAGGPSSGRNPRLLVGSRRTMSTTAADTIDDCQARLDAAGWSIGDMAGCTTKGVMWVVFARRGDERVVARTRRQATA
jgi:ELWxxDGT repeat protein